VTIACGLILAQSPLLLRADAQATDEILKSLPSDMAACLIIEDISPTLDRILSSPEFRGWTQRPIIQRWIQSPSYRSFQGLIAFLPFYFGVDNQSLLRDFVGSSVVLSFRPGTAQAPAVGIIACRATNEDVLNKIVTNLSKAIPDRTIEVHQHAGYSFTERHEFGTRHDFILQLGRTLFVSDKRTAIEQIIDTHQAKSSLFDSPKFQEMRRRIKTRCVASLLVDPEPFRPLVQRAVDAAQGSARPVAERVGRLWEHLSWGTASLHIADTVSLSLDWSIESTGENLPEAKFLRQWCQPSSFWSRVSADVMAAVSTQIDFVAAMQLIQEIAQGEPSIAGLLAACSDLSVGFDSTTEILPSLGPEVGFVARLDSDGSILGVLDLPLQTLDRKGPMGLTLAQSLEMLVFRPLFVFYVGDHNQRFADQARVETTEIDGERFHGLAGSVILPEAYQPGFAVSESRILFVSSPKALSEWTTPGEKPWVGSERANRIKSAIGENEQMKAYLNVDQLVTYLESFETTASTNQPSSRIRDLVSIVSVFEMATLSASQEGNNGRTTLTLFPKTSTTPSK
jgi:hypothetical protein